MSLDPITRKEYFLSKAAGNDVTTPEPITREEMFLQAIIDSGSGGGGGGGSVTVDSALNTTSTNPVQNKVIAAALNGKAAAETIVTVSGTTPSIAAAANTLYLCSEELTSLAITSVPTSGLFEIVFASGSTATELVLPSNIILPDGVTIEANTIYDISVRMCTVGGNLVGLAAVQSWRAPEEEEST